MKTALYKILILVLCLIPITATHAQKPKGDYKSNKNAIRKNYMDEIKAIAAKRNISPRERKKQRDAAISKYRSDKRNNRQAFRRSTDLNRSAFERKNRGRVPKLQKN